MSIELTEKKSLLSKISPQRKNQINFLIFASFSVIFMILIFFFSHQTALKSAFLSDSLSDIVVDTLDPNAEEQRALKVLLFGFFVRKFAHFVLFAALGFFLMGAAINIDGKKQLTKLVWVSAIGLFYAIADEVHQIFVDGRSSEIYDVLLDFGGIVCGILMALLIYKIILFLGKKRKIQ